MNTDLMFSSQTDQWETPQDFFDNLNEEKAEIRFIKGRLRFGNSKNSAPFPSMVVVFRPDYLKERSKK